MSERAALRPPRNISVSDWADENRILNRSSSAMPGPWRTKRTPYLREPMDAFKLSYVRSLVLCFGTQLGKTELELNLLGYCIDQEPSSALVVYPTDELGKSVVKNRIIPMIDSSPAIARHYNPFTSEIMELQFDGMYVAVVGANSPSKLASRPIKYLFLDETDKFPVRAGKDSSPKELARERQKTYSGRKEVQASSPTYTDGEIWKDFKAAQMQKRYYVPCPHCGTYQQLTLGGIKWPAELNEPAHKDEREARVINESWYECPHCKRRIFDMDKGKMLALGEWRAVTAVKDDKGRERWEERPARNERPESVGYNINSLYSPMVTFGEVAQKFLKTKDDPVAYMSFVNGWLAEPWEAVAATMNPDIVMERRAGYEQGVVPAAARILTCAVDVQEDCFWYSVYAWGTRMKGWLIDYGCVYSWDDVQNILDKEWAIGETGQLCRVQLMLIDSGFHAHEVYDFCVLNPGVAIPSKGSSVANPNMPIKESRVEDKRWGGLELLIIDTAYYKRAIHDAIKPPKPEMKPSWNIYEGIHREYAEHICSEHCVISKNKNGQQVRTWKQVADGAPNHLLDCAVYAMAGAERLGARHLTERGDTNDGS